MKKGLFAVFALLSVAPLVAFAKEEAGVAPPKDKFVVVLDAGHGGHDPGNLGNGFLEKAIALNIVLKAGETLEKDSDVEVVYTRKKDVFVDLHKRGEIANKANADLFVSVHCDAHHSDAEGAGTFVLGLHANQQNFEVAKKENSVIYLEDEYEERYAKYDIDSPESIIGLTIMQEEFLDQSVLLGKKLQDNFAKGLKRKDRKVKQAGFIVLHQTFMPSVLVEVGFLTNKAEGDYLNSEAGQQEMGKAIADAVLAYRTDVGKGFSTTNLVLEEAVEIVPKATAIPISTTKVPAVAAQTSASQPQKSKAAANASKPIKTDASVVANAPAVAPKASVAQPQKSKAPANTSKTVRIDTTIVVNVPVAASQSPAAQQREIKSVTKALETAETDTKVVHATLVAPQESASKAKEDKASEASGGDSRYSASSSNSELTFKVQLVASSKNLPLTGANFRGLNELSKEPYKNLYRYFYGNTNSIDEAKRLKDHAVAKGYAAAYIVAYKNGERVPVWKILK